MRFGGGPVAEFSAEFMGFSADAVYFRADRGNILHNKHTFDGDFEQNYVKNADLLKKFKKTLEKNIIIG